MSSLIQDYELSWYWQVSQNVEQYGSEDYKSKDWTKRAEMKLEYSPSESLKQILSRAENGYQGFLSLLIGVGPGHVISRQIANNLCTLLITNHFDNEKFHYAIGLKPSLKPKFIKMLQTLDVRGDFGSIIALTLLFNGYCFKGIREKVTQAAMRLISELGLMIELSRIEALAFEQSSLDVKFVTTTFLRARAIIMTQDDPNQDPTKLLKASEETLFKIFNSYDDRFSRATTWMIRTQNVTTMKVKMSDKWFKQNCGILKEPEGQDSNQDASECDLVVDYDAKKNSIKLKNSTTISLKVRFRIGLARHQIVIHSGSEQRYNSQGKLCWFNDEAIKHSGSYKYKLYEGFIDHWIPTDDLKVSQGSIAYYIFSETNQIVIINKLDQAIDLPMLTEDGWRHITVYSGRTRIMALKWKLKSIIRDPVKVDILVSMTSDEYQYATRKTPIYEGRIHYETDSSSTDDSDDNASYDDY